MKDKQTSDTQTTETGTLSPPTDLAVPPEKRPPRIGRYVLFAIVAVILFRILLSASNDISQSRQIMGGTYNIGSFKGAIGHLGGVPVKIPSGYALFMEYDGDPQFGYKRKGPVPPRTYESGISSFGFKLLYPEMKDNDWIAAGRADIFTSMWLHIGVVSNSAYNASDERNMTSRANGMKKIREHSHRFTELPDRPYGLVGYTPLDPKPGGRVALWKQSPGKTVLDPDDKNLNFHYADDGEVDTYIECPNVDNEAISCNEEFLLLPEINARVTVNFRRALLPHWREIKEGVTRTFLSFRVNPADGSPLMPADQASPTSSPQ